MKNIIIALGAILLIGGGFSYYKSQQSPVELHSHDHSGHDHGSHEGHDHHDHDHGSHEGHDH